MKSLKLYKVITMALAITSILALTPMGASAQWKKDDKGLLYTEGNLYVTGWKNINDSGIWYYFSPDGHMAHDTTIEGCYLNSSGVWTNSSNTSINSLIGQEILKNISVENPSFSIDLPKNNLSMEDMKNIIIDEMKKLRLTNPSEMFNIPGYNFGISRRGSSTTVKIDCTYKITTEMEAELDAKVKEIVSTIAPDSMSQSEKELAIHDWIVNNTRYDQTYTIHDPYNTLFKHTGVCEGYALLAQKMFTASGIKSLVVEGRGRNESHAWNLVYIDNKWRHVDCTWDDPVSSRDILRHDYYNITDQEISKEHTWDTTAYPSAN